MSCIIISFVCIQLAFPIYLLVSFHQGESLKMNSYNGATLALL